MIVSINQPAYLPWLGYFNRVANSDLHIVLDHVQYEKNSFTNRNKIRTAQGFSWLTLPLKTKGRFGKLAINTVEIADIPSWNRKHWDSLRFAYAKAPYFKDYMNWLETAYAKQWLLMGDVLNECNDWLYKCLGIDTPIVYSSDLGISTTKDRLIIDLCLKVEATTYLSGPLGRNYLKPKEFEAAGIELTYHDYQHPVYQQFQGGVFLPYMSTVDLLFNEGAESERIVKR